MRMSWINTHKDLRRESTYQLPQMLELIVTSLNSYFLLCDFLHVPFSYDGYELLLQLGKYGNRERICFKEKKNNDYR